MVEPDVLLQRAQEEMILVALAHLAGMSETVNVYLIVPRASGRSRPGVWNFHG
jgi:hypothetical protein